MCIDLKYDVGLPNRYQLEHLNISDLLSGQLRLGTTTKCLELLFSVTNGRLQLKNSVDTLYRNLQNDVNQACLILYKQLQDNLIVESVSRLLQCSYRNQCAKSDKSAEKTFPDFGLCGLFLVELLLKGILVKQQTQFDLRKLFK